MRDLQRRTKGTNPIVSFLVNAEPGEFITTCKYTNQITSSSADEIEELNNMQTELEQNKAELQQAKSQLEAEQKNAEDAGAGPAAPARHRQKPNRKMPPSLPSLEADKAAAAEKLSGEGVSGSNSSSQATNTNTTIDTTVNNSNTGSPDYDSFINGVDEPRHDEYLAGSPMAGQGNLAVAAWNTGVSTPVGPPPSPASRAPRCLLRFYLGNAGAGVHVRRLAQLGSWSEGISAHVAYSSANYGSTPPRLRPKVLPAHMAGLVQQSRRQMNRI